MHLLDINFYIILKQINQNERNSIFKFFAAIAPILSVLASLASLGLAFVVFRYTQRKNDNDVKIKWFQELIYTPNKEILNNYFQSLYTLNSRITVSVLSDEEKIDIMNFIKGERNMIFQSFVDVIKPISTETHLKISKAIDELTDKLTNAFDNDSINLLDSNVYTGLITNPISQTRNAVTIALFNYKGESRI